MTRLRADNIDKVRRDAAADKARVRRTYSIKVDATEGAKQRADGSWEFDGVATRGDAVFDYSYDMGRTWREYRPPDEVFAPLSIDSLIGAAITDDHPAEFVDIFNARDLSRGHVINAWRDGNLMRVRVLVRDAELLRKIFELGKVELSCGYTARTEGPPGTHPVEGPYEATQREIIHNHLAVVDAARAGPQARLAVPTLPQAAETGANPAAATGDKRAASPPRRGQKDAPVNELIVNGTKYAVSATAAEVPEALAMLWAQMEQQLAEANKKIQELQAAAGGAATTPATPAADPNAAAAPAAETPEDPEMEMGDKNKGDKAKGGKQPEAAAGMTKAQIDALVQERVKSQVDAALKQHGDAATRRARIIGDAGRVLPKTYEFEGKSDADVLADAVISCDKSYEGIARKLAKDNNTERLHGILIAKIDAIESAMSRGNLLASGALVRDAQSDDTKNSADAARDRMRDRKLGTKTSNTAAGAAGNGK
ncbi:MAG TPA: DUF2213 domain-containing protein [Thermoanaerobaculaceae bacterium]|nr:DUF2213 domain-containing protein [Thermoanaerobaculaceae bacterium]HRU10367.1 DUF2213 domain-containing protein [Thermoanaerobaculia bacterium]